MTMTDTTPSLAQRVFPLVVFGYLVAAIRLGLDFMDREIAMYFGLYYMMPVAYLVAGRKRLWGVCGWKTMAGTMMVIGVLVWGVTDSIVYTLAQFMEWTDGRFFPGEKIVGADGVISYGKGWRNLPIAESALGKVGYGLLHGAFASVIGGSWSVLVGTLFVWIPRRTLKR